MNLLPKCHEEFSREDYWNEFFTKRGKKAFEWYGEYPELCGELSKYVKIKDDVLIVGCGNSKLSTDLYDVGYRSVTSIDISSIVIEQMRNKNRNDRPNLIFEQMDATKMTYSDGKFSVILDKGTLDALMPNNSEETNSRIDKYFTEINRVLRKGGRYICISLLQEHILKKLVSYFPKSGFMFRITKCHDVEDKMRDEERSAFPVFIVMATKFPGLTQQILELAMTIDTTTRASNTEELVNTVLSIQQSALVCDRLQKKSIADVGEITLDLFAPGNDNPRYTIYIVDRPNTPGKSYVAFLVPQGRDTHWLFGTKEGRKHFAEIMEKDRIAIITLRRNHTFKDWDEVKQELSPAVKNFAPPKLPTNTSIAFVSLGPDVGKREILHECQSEFNGRIAIEDAYSNENDYKYRRLVFMSNEFVVQSESHVKIVKSRRGKAKDVIDFGVLACEHHSAMCVGANVAINANSSDEALVIGLGGGGLCMFLHQCYPKLNVTAVEIDETIFKLAKSWFNFIVDNRSEVVITDGLKYLDESAAMGKKFSVIIFDVNGNDTSVGLSCPPKEFLESTVLNTVTKCLQINGLFILNFVCRDTSLRPTVIENLKKIFSSVTSIKTQNMVNEILICSTMKKDEETWKKELEKSVNDLNQRVRDRKLLTKDVATVDDIFEDLTIEA